MKELSIEEKAKAYDEAIEKLRSLHDDYDTVSTLIDIKKELEERFPELKESWDEKVRKWLIEMVEEVRKANPTNAEHNGVCSEAIAWIEKHGGKGVVLRDTFGHEAGRQRGREEGVMLVLDNPRKYGLEKQGEQKPTDEEMIALLRTEYEKGRADAIAEMQKSWSEEDERKIELLKSLIEDAKGDSTSYSTMFREMEELNNWLKSLKNRVLPQSRQEWSEDDENRINRLIAYFEDKESFTAEDDIVYANWFKSLKDRYTWKPSDSQMGALWDSIKHNLHLHPVLESLYNDLKKLKG